MFSGDPVSAGFAQSLSHPRENMTGLTFMAAELNGKRLEILRDLVPGLPGVAIFTYGPAARCIARERDTPNRRPALPPRRAIKAQL
ncbi:MAG: hypothetical protein ABIV63_07190 [Caldimonas sp.]